MSRSVTPEQLGSSGFTTPFGSPPTTPARRRPISFPTERRAERERKGSIDSKDSSEAAELFSLSPPATVRDAVEAVSAPASGALPLHPPFLPRVLLIDLKLSPGAKDDGSLDGLYLARWAREQIQRRGDLPANSSLAALKVAFLLKPRIAFSVR